MENNSNKMTNCFYDKTNVSFANDELKKQGSVTLLASQSLNDLFGDVNYGVQKTLTTRFDDGTTLLFPEERHCDYQVKCKRKLEIVVARYNETLAWRRQFLIFEQQNYTIYNKGPNDEFERSEDDVILPVENIGRNDHTYLYHIVKNYGCLADVTIFFPGSLHMSFKFIEAAALLKKVLETDKAWMFETKCDDVCAHFENFQLDQWICSADKNRALNAEQNLTPAETRPFGNWYRKTYNTQVTTGYFFHGLFAVDRDTILKRPLSFYKDILRQLSVSSNPEVGHYTERTWHAMFPGISTIPLAPESAFLYPSVLIPARLLFVSDNVEMCFHARESGYFNQVLFFSGINSKSLMILNAIQSLGDGEVLCFAESHYRLQPESYDYVQMVLAILCGSDYDNVVYENGKKEIDNTPLQVLQAFPTVSYESFQLSTSHFFIKKTDETVKLVEEWSKISSLEDGLFSCLLKQHNKSFITKLTLFH